VVLTLSLSHDGTATAQRGKQNSFHVLYLVYTQTNVFLPRCPLVILPGHLNHHVIHIIFLTNGNIPRITGNSQRRSLQSLRTQQTACLFIPICVCTSVTTAMAVQSESETLFIPKFTT